MVGRCTTERVRKRGSGSLPIGNCRLPIDRTEPAGPIRHLAIGNWQFQRSAFTMVELLVVVGLILVLLGAVIVAAPALIDRGKTQSTQLLLHTVQTMIDEFEREQKAAPTITRARQPGSGGVGHVNFKDLFGYFPPDELEPFSMRGMRGSQSGSGSLAPGGAKVILGTNTDGNNYPAMRFFLDGDVSRDPFEHRDIAALVLAVELFGGSQSRAMLEGLSDAHLRPGPRDDKGEPQQYLDRNNNGKWDALEDLELRHIVDSWGVPLAYFSTRGFDDKKPGNNKLQSTNHPEWFKVSSQLVAQNGGRPVLMSWGPDGREQLARDIQSAEPTASVVGDLAVHTFLRNPLNRDNVFADPALKQKLETVP